MKTQGYPVTGQVAQKVPAIVKEKQKNFFYISVDIFCVGDERI